MKTIGVSTSPFALITEYVNGGNLSELLHSGNDLPWAARLKIVEEIAKGIQTLHSHTPQVNCLLATK